MSLAHWIVYSGVTLMICSSFYSKSSYSEMIEICDNGIDDDEDSLIDLNDPDCDCALIKPESLIPNPSFEDQNCCPTGRSQLSCADVWIQASEPTTDYINTCGWMGWDDFPPPQPFPDGEGIMGFRDGRVFMNTNEPNWKEYAGACLLGPLLAGNKYRFQFHVGFVDGASSPPINITIFGSTDCENLPFGVGNDFFGCPTNGPGWSRLGSRRVSSFQASSWVISQIDVTPSQDIYAIAIGPDCPEIVTTTSLYYFFDKLVLDDLRSFEFEINEVAHPCSDEFLLSVPNEGDLQYQWYKEGIALIGETESTITRLYGEGKYQVRIQSSTGTCNLTRSYVYRIPIRIATDQVVICNDEEYLFGRNFLSASGTYVDTFQSVHGCDSIVTLSLNVLEELETEADVGIFEGETYEIGKESLDQPGNYQVGLTTSIGCDSTVFVSLSYYDVYFPNAFSPNGDGRNDYLFISGNGDIEEISDLMVFNRWGSKIYHQSTSKQDEPLQWDGTYNGAYVASGVYTYMARLKMIDGKTRNISRSILVVK